MSGISGADHLDDLRQAGKIRHIGLSKVTIDQIEHARRHTIIAAIQNRHSADTDDPALAHAEQHGLAYVAHQPFRADPTFSEAAPDDRARRAKHVLRTLIQLSPALLTIPGTASYRHLEENSAMVSTGFRA